MITMSICTPDPKQGRSNALRLARLYSMNALWVSSDPELLGELDSKGQAACTPAQLMDGSQLNTISKTAVLIIGKMTESEYTTIQPMLAWSTLPVWLLNRAMPTMLGN